MRAVVQRVRQASVRVDGVVKGSIDGGLMVLLGVAPEDTSKDVDWMARKLMGLRIFDDANGLMNRSVVDIDGAILVVSQFTLYGDCRKGNRPGFTGAAAPELADRLYREVVEELRKGLGEKRVATGVFGAEMQVALVNDGPVTLIIETAYGNS